jgi:hypothetical protein
MKSRGLLFSIIGLTGVVICLAFGFVWEVRARALLALEGYVFVQLTAPTNCPEFGQTRGGYFVSQAVFEGGKCVGFLDMQGQFVKLAARGPDANKVFWFTWVNCVLFSAFAITLLIGLALLLSSYADRTIETRWRL